MENVPPIADFAVGHEFVPTRFRIQPQVVALYLKAVGESDALFHKEGYVPPTALAAYALDGVLREINLPPGAIHSSQDVSVTRPITSEETLVFRATLTRNWVRSGWRLVSIDFSGVDGDDKQVMHGKSTVVISEARGDDGR